jgi:hypothetical protein
VIGKKRRRLVVVAREARAVAETTRLPSDFVGLFSFTVPVHRIII